jgi:hypothetical protein
VLAVLIGVGELKVGDDLLNFRQRDPIRQSAGQYLCASAFIGVLAALRVIHHRAALGIPSSLRNIWYAVTNHREVGATSVTFGKLDGVRQRTVRERTAADHRSFSALSRG